MMGNKDKGEHWLLEDPGIQWVLKKLEEGKTPEEIEKEYKDFHEQGNCS